MKTILITGSARGIGKAIAKKAASQGYSVILHGRTNSPELEALNNELTGSQKVFFDVSDEDAVKNVFESLGPVDVLVNNAGVALGRNTSIESISDEAALEEYKINNLGAIHCTKNVLSKMKNGGSIVNVASIKADPNLSSLSTITYAQSKAALVVQTKAFAKELAKNNIRVNCVLPGYTETEVAKSWPDTTIKKANEGSLLRRMALPGEIASAVMFLASDEASYITGVDLLVDGGFAISGK